MVDRKTHEKLSTFFVLSFLGGFFVYTSGGGHVLPTFMPISFFRRASRSLRRFRKGDLGNGVSLSFFSLAFLKIPRKTSKTPRVFSPCETLKTLENKLKTPKILSKFPASKTPRKQKHQGKEGNAVSFLSRFTGACLVLQACLVVFQTKVVHF